MIFPANHLTGMRLLYSSCDPHGSGERRTGS